MPVPDRLFPRRSHLIASSGIETSISFLHCIHLPSCAKRDTFVQGLHLQIGARPEPRPRPTSLRAQFPGGAIVLDLRNLVVGAPACPEPTAKPEKT